MSNTVKTTSYKDRIKAAKRSERIVRVCLRGDLWARAQDLDTQLRTIEAKSSNDERFVGNTEAQRLAVEVEQVAEEMRANTEVFLLRALPRDQWNELRAAHPPREDDPRDVNARVNVDTFAAALLPLSIVEPEMDSDDWAATLEVLNDRQYEDLFSGAWEVNESSVSVPFSPAASKIRNSVSELKRPND